MQFIPVSASGETVFALVDDEDFSYLSTFHWCCSRGYAVTGVGRTTRSMHRMVLNPGKRVLVDHKNRIKLDNRRENLRPADHSLNAVNAKRRSNNRTGFLGIDYHKSNKKYRARIFKDRRQHVVGYFTDKIEAARARDAAAIQFWGEDTPLNFPRQ